MHGAETAIATVSPAQSMWLRCRSTTLATAIRASAIEAVPDRPPKPIIVVRGFHPTRHDIAISSAVRGMAKATELKVIGNAGNKEQMDFLFHANARGAGYYFTNPCPRRSALDSFAQQRPRHRSRSRTRQLLSDRLRGRFAQIDPSVSSPALCIGRASAAYNQPASVRACLRGSSTRDFPMAFFRRLCPTVR